jgi:hypothetical protein
MSASQPSPLLVLAGAAATGEDGKLTTDEAA